MLRALYTASTGMLAQQMGMDAVSNNLANVNTHGYKKARVEFQDLLYTQLQSPARGEVSGISIGAGVRLSNISRIFSGGNLDATGNDLDLAIQGEGFLRVERSDGAVLYTRDGALRLNAERQIVTASGEVVLGVQGPITIPAEAEKVEISADGTISYLVGAKYETAGQLTIAKFANPAGLEALGGNLWAETDSSGAEEVVTAGGKTGSHIVQRYLEGSNVQAIEEMVSLITAQRAYEINSKVVQSADEMMSLANNLRRG